MHDTILIPTSSGHELAVCEWGPSHGEPVFVLHGSPGSRYIRHPAGEYDRVGIRVLTYDRPGTVARPVGRVGWPRPQLTMSP